MGTIVTICPVTGVDISTGIETDPVSFAAMPNVASLVHCPICNAEHEWQPRTARLKDIEPPNVQVV